SRPAGDGRRAREQTGVTRWARVLPALASIGLILAVSPHAGAVTGGPVFGAIVRLEGADGGTEPQVTIGPGDRRWVITNDESQETAIVYGSRDRGLTWSRTPSDPAGQDRPTLDVDVVTTRTGRIIATELDAVGFNLRVAYSDDGGTTWTRSTGTALIDQDRQWLGVGTDDPGTHQPRVYLYYHNLFGGV